MKSIHSLTILLALGILAVAADGDPLRAWIMASSATRLAVAPSAIPSG